MALPLSVTLLARERPPPPPTPRPPLAASGGGWFLSEEGASCDDECAASGGVCNGDALRRISSAAAILEAAAAAGVECTGGTVGWGYASNPGICSHGRCCGDADGDGRGDCEGICAWGSHADVTCATRSQDYARLCRCEPPTSGGSEAPPSPSQSPKLLPGVTFGDGTVAGIEVDGGSATNAWKSGPGAVAIAACVVAALAIAVAIAAVRRKPTPIVHGVGLAAADSAAVPMQVELVQAYQPPAVGTDVVTAYA